VSQAVPEYLRYWGLSRPPFSLTPDPGMLFLSAQHKECLLRLKYAVASNKGGALLVSENAGDGKTSVLARLVQDLKSEYDNKLRTVFIDHPTLTPNQMISEIARQLGVTGLQEKVSILNELRELLKKLHDDGYKTLVMIDEGQMLSHRPDLLQELRILLNFYISDAFLLTCIFSGQKPLEAAIMGMPEFWQRVPVRFFLKNLNYEDTRDLIRYRLSKAGLQDREIFSEQGYEGIFRFSQGCPRIICSVADLALVIGCSRMVRKIDFPEVAQATNDMQRSGESYYYFQYLESARDSEGNGSDLAPLDPSQPGRFCPQCGFPTQPGSRFCGQCGSPRFDGQPPQSTPQSVAETVAPVRNLSPPGAGIAATQRICPECGEAVEKGARQCPGCGHIFPVLRSKAKAQSLPFPRPQQRSKTAGPSHPATRNESIQALQPSVAVAQGVIRCNHCRKDSPQGTELCLHCGTPLFILCYRCSTKSPRGSLACSKCGISLVSESSVAEKEFNEGIKKLQLNIRPLNAKWTSRISLLASGENLLFVLPRGGLFSVGAKVELRQETKKQIDRHCGLAVTARSMILLHRNDSTFLHYSEVESFRAEQRGARSAKDFKIVLQAREGSVSIFLPFPLWKSKIFSTLLRDLIRYKNPNLRVL